MFSLAPVGDKQFNSALPEFCKPNDRNRRRCRRSDSVVLPTGSTGKRGCGQFQFMRCRAFDAHGKWQTIPMIAERARS